MKSIAFIDNFIETPINHCVNEIILRNKIPGTYHQPARFGLRSLQECTEIDGIIILGSASNVTEPVLWHRELMEILIPWIEKGTPTLGICFGHQLIAHHFGCEVGYINEERTLFQKIRQTQFKQPLWNTDFGTSFPMPYSHQQIVKNVSDHFEILASTEEFSFEGLKHKNYNLWTIQGHPESSLKFLIEYQNLNEEEARATKKWGDHFIDSFCRFVITGGKNGN